MAAILAAERDDGLVADELKRAAADAPAGAPARREGTTGTNQ